MEPKEIQKVLLHRFPFLMVDRVLEIEYGKKSTGIKNVSMNEPWVKGHFPEEPIFPGVLIIETMAQVGAMIFYNPQIDQSGLKGYLCGVDKVKLTRKVIPGDTLLVEAEMTERIGNLAQVKCTVKVEGKTVAKGLVSYAFEK